MFPEICKPLVIYRVYCMTLNHSQTPHHMININTKLSDSINPESNLIGCKFNSYLHIKLNLCNYDVCWDFLAKSPTHLILTYM